jgi:hypothetical protein
VVKSKRARPANQHPFTGQHTYLLATLLKLKHTVVGNEEDIAKVAISSS